MQVAQVNGYEEYKKKVDELEHGKGRIVFLFLGTDSKSKEAEKTFGELKDVKGKLVKVYVGDLSKATEFKTDKKFAVGELPYAAVYNRKLALGKEMVQRKLHGDALSSPEKIKFLFSP